MQRIEQGINYVWAIIKPFHTYTRNRTYGNFENILYKNKNLLFHFWISSIKSEGRELQESKYIDKDKFLSQLNSYMWFIKHSKYKKRFVIIYNKYKKYLDKYYYLDIERIYFVLRDW